MAEKIYDANGKPEIEAVWLVLKTALKDLAEVICAECGGCGHI